MALLSVDCSQWNRKIHDFYLWQKSVKEQSWQEPVNRGELGSISSNPVENTAEWQKFSSPSFGSSKRTEFGSKVGSAWGPKTNEGNTKEEPKLRVKPTQDQGSGAQGNMYSDKIHEDIPIYRISLLASSTKKEREDFDEYKEKVKASGWSLTPVEASASERLAYIVSPEGKGGDLQAAAYVAASILEETLRRFASDR
ncbi:MAG: hypothetical protein F6K11_26315 [Leptolyngbya sp. SIO3F4]|nr:hypothetical protein [Leptolyngbya sp. SIO3F4]